MSFVVPTSSTPKYEPLTEGLYQAVVAEIIDVGVIQEKFDDAPTHKLKIVFQLDAVRDDGKRHELRSWNERVSFHEKAYLRTRYLDKLFGKKQVEEIIADETFDLASVVGVNCMIDVIHDKSGEYANIGTILGYRGKSPITVSADYVPIQQRDSYKPPQNYAVPDDADLPRAVAPTPAAPLPPTNRPPVVRGEVPADYRPEGGINDGPRHAAAQMKQTAKSLAKGGSTATAATAVPEPEWDDNDPFDDDAVPTLAGMPAQVNTAHR